jgi:glycosyltransferase involved in cell wall biosynthesis
MKKDDIRLQAKMKGPPFRALAIMRMGDIKVKYHLQPLALASRVSSLCVIRPQPINETMLLDNMPYFEINGRSLIAQLWGVMRKAFLVAKDPYVRVLVSFYALPYGMMALLLGKVLGKPVHVGFVGSDWYKIGCTWYGRLFDILFRQADLITVTGQRMRAQMRARGYSQDQIRILPHAVNDNPNANVPPDKRPYDCIFAGYLKALKRVDLIVQAIKRVKGQYPNIKLCILGDGPQKPALIALVRHCRLEENVHFAGHQVDTAKWFSASKMVIIASEREGFPFALVEGMMGGAVPVATAVGTIPDFVQNGKTGVLIPPGDESAIADAILRLVKDKVYYDQLRRAVLSQRAEFGFEKATQIWESWLVSIA